MSYWAEVMQDDCYIIAADGWVAETYRIQVENKQKKLVDKGWICDLIPESLVIDRFYKEYKKAIEELEVEKETINNQLTELEEENSHEEGCFAELEKVNKGNVQTRLKEAKNQYTEAPDDELKEEIGVLEEYLKLKTQETALAKKIKDAIVELDKKTLVRYQTLTEDEIKSLVVDDKWMKAIEKSMQTEMEQISQKLAHRIRELTERYEATLPQQTIKVMELSEKVNSHLERMGFIWN